jgi:three-Cys-motif partner protein
MSRILAKFAPKKLPSMKKHPNHNQPDPQQASSTAGSVVMLNSLENYVKEYLGVMDRYREKYRWQLLYFDGFAGSGTRHTLRNPHPLLADLLAEGLAENDLMGYKGAAERILALPESDFDSYYFIDLDRESNHKLRIKLEKFQTEDGKLTFRADDVNVQLANLARTLHADSNLRALVILDPIGMQIEWSSLSKLTNLGVDLWLLLPTATVLSLLLDRHGAVERYDLLKQSLGMSETEMRGSVDHQSVCSSLQGLSQTTRLVTQSALTIAQLYLRCLRSVFNEVAEQPLLLSNPDGFPLVHMVFASNNKNALKLNAEIMDSLSIPTETSGHEPFTNIRATI